MIVYIFSYSADNRIHDLETNLWLYWDEISLFIFVMIFPYFLAFLLIFMNMQIMQIRYVAYLTME